MKHIYLTLISLVLLTYSNAQQDPWYGGDYLVSSDSCSFSDTCEFIELQSGSQWEIGSTNKTFFSNNFTGRALMTDTVDFYSDADTSYFQLDLTGLESYYDNFQGMTFMVEFYHKMQSDTLKDGGFITVSLDSGITWQNIESMDQWGGDYAELRKHNIYSTSDTLFTGEKGYSGTYDWLKSGFEFIIIYPIKFNHLDPMVRFNFISDNVANNMDGWMIDSLVIAEHYLDGSIDDHAQNMGFDVYPNPVTNTLQIEMVDQNKSTVGEYVLLDLSGRKVTSKPSGGVTTEMDVSALISGVYIIRWIGKDGTTADRKVIVR